MKQRIQVIRELHEPPESIVQLLTDAGGRNRFGGPNYRVIWGWNRLDWIGGLWADRDASGNVIREVFELRREPKYHQLNRWILEAWVAPEVYGSPARWYAQTAERENGTLVHALGPYPLYGDYEQVLALENPDGSFLQLTATAALHIAAALEKSRYLDKAKKKAGLKTDLEKADDAIVERDYDILDDGTPAFSDQPFVTVKTVEDGHHYVATDAAGKLKWAAAGKYVDVPSNPKVN